MNEFAKKILVLVEKSQDIIITSHLSPDEDAIASVLSLYHYLSNKYPGKNITPLLASTSLDQYQSFTNYSDIQFVSDIKDHLSDKDLLIMLDGSQYSRFTNSPKVIKNFQGKTVCIDHHPNKPDDFDLSLVKDDATSATELIYNLFYKNEDINPQVAQVLLVGILGDTGNFAYLPPDQSHVFSIAQRLLTLADTDIQSLQSRYRSIDPQIFKLIKKLINNTDHHQIENWPPVQTSFLTRQDIKKCLPAQVSEASHIYMSHYLRHLTGYPWGAVFTPKPDKSVKISLRSLPDGTNVRKIMERIGIGGGHNLAAGGAYQPDTNQALKAQKAKQIFLDWLKNNQPNSK